MFPTKFPLNKDFSLDDDLIVMDEEEDAFGRHRKYS